MKNVWIINHYAQLPLGPGSTRHFSLARYLRQHGWETTIIAASTELNTGRQRLAKDEECRVEKFDGVPFLWLKTSVYSGNGAARVVNMLMFSFKVLLRRNTKKLACPDIIIGSSVHMAAALAGFFLSRRYKVPFVFEVRDLWPQTLIDLGRVKPGNLIVKLLKYTEKYLYRKAKHIVVLLPRASDYIVPLGISPKKITWVPNGVDLSDYPVPVQHAKRDKFVLMYVGAHGKANTLNVVLHAMKLLSERSLSIPIKLMLIGDGAYKLELMAEAAQLGLNNIVFKNAVPKQTIPDTLKEANAFVLSVSNCPELYKYGISMNKLFDYMAAGRPTVIATNAINNPIAEADAGVTVAPEDPLAMADGIEELVSMSPIEQMALGRSAREWVEKHHSYDRLALCLANVLRQSISIQVN